MSTKLAKSGVLIQVKSIRTPDNFAALLAEPRIKRLAKSIGSVTQIHAITVQKLPDGGYKLWAGHDRFAAVTLAGKQTIRADVRTGADVDFILLQAAENIERRGDAVDLVEAYRNSTQLLEAGGDKTPNLSPPSKAKSRQAVAEAKGMKPESIKKAEQRARAKSSAIPQNSGTLSGAGAASAEEPAPFPDNLNVLGIEDASTEAVCRFARPVQEAIDEADKHLRLALGALKRIEATSVGKMLRERVGFVADLVRNERPASVCPWCKGLPKATVGYCNACDGAGYVPASTAEGAPREALRLIDPVVIVDKKAYPYADVRDGKVRPASNGAVPTKPAKTIRVEDEAGNEIPINDDDAPF